MSYRSLYRKWRPSNFSQVVGQEHITRTLKNALLRNNVSHAYLFCGPRGTGKTTVAKILARAVNCTNISSSEPCGQCKPCQHIITGASMDVFELDAASNRGIDEVRDLKEKTRYVASEGKHKVYIIDEAHMLTNEAFNALLKTLEEPPPGVIFILATTEPSKLPPTVISRCQRLDFRLLTTSEVNERIQEVACKEEWNYEEEALLLIAQLAEGALRDALGLMEQVYAFGEGRIMAENVYNLAGLAKEETIGRVVKALFDNDVAGGLVAVQEVTFGGKDLQLFLKEQMYFFKQLLVVQASGIEVSGEERYRDYLLNYKDSFSQESLLEIISLLHRATGEIRFSEHASFILDIAFLNMLRAVKHNSVNSLEALALRIENIEEKLAERITKGKVSADYAEQKLIELKPNHKENDKNSNGENKKPDDTVITRPTVPAREEFKNEIQPLVSQENNSVSLKDIWLRILESFQKNKRQVSTQALLQMLQPESLEEGCLNLSYEQKNSFLKDKISEASRRKLIEKVASEVVGRDIFIKLDVRVEEEENEDLSSQISETIWVNNKETIREHPLQEEQIVKSEQQPKQKKEKKVASRRYNDFIFEEALKLFEGKIIENDN